MKSRAAPVQRSTAKAMAIAVVVAILALIGVAAQYLPMSRSSDKPSGMTASLIAAAPKETATIDQPMEPSLLVAILSIVIASTIGLAALAYARKQVKAMNEQMSKKRHLETALSNLKDAIERLETANDMLAIDPSIGPGFPVGFEENYTFAWMIVFEILQAAFESKLRKISLKVSYRLIDRSSKDVRTIHDFSGLTPQWLVRVLDSGKMSLETATRILIDESIFKRWSSVELGFDIYLQYLQMLSEAKKTLSRFEEVYETVSPDCVKKVDQVYGDICKEIFKTISIDQPKQIDVDLDKFSTAEEMAVHLMEEVLNYSRVLKNFSGVAGLLDPLRKVRKDLFLRIF